MLIYLDSRDLINLFEKSNPCSPNDFDKILIGGGHKLVYSWLNIAEISEPLLHAKAKTNVMALLNRVEESPHTYIHSSRIPHLELTSAVKTYAKGEEYEKVDPYVHRFDYTVELNARPSTRDYLNYPLAEIVWDLHTFGALGGLDRFAEKLKQTFAADRALQPKPSLKKHFPVLVKKNLKLHNVTGANAEIKTFANWIYSNAARCPSQRLGYEVWHKMIKNVQDEPTPSDMEDFCHLECLPYVDFMTLDNRMRGYVSQACKATQTNHFEKLNKDTAEIIGKLQK
ncbi:MAG: hypothetical protein KKG47_03780 [Proteobacteria bacterium]|nr:hypothetical protein [Pseudomonadota bacterium]MBU1738067.1 hypothetical protein [Pseudomonadota bacterium]